MGQEFTESATSRFARIREGNGDLNIHYNDCDPGAGGDVVVMLHGSDPGATGWANFNRNIAPPTDAGFRLVADIPNSELHVFNNSGHWVQREYTGKFNRMVLDFLAH